MAYNSNDVPKIEELTAQQKTNVIAFNGVLLVSFFGILILSLYVCLFQLRRVKIIGYYIWTFYLCVFLLSISRIVELTMVLINPNIPYFKTGDDYHQLASLPNSIASFVMLALGLVIVTTIYQIAI